MSAPAIEAVDLVKTFDDFTAVDGVSFSVPAGTVFSMLGPNGAGKTTTVRMMTTLSIPTSGTARVAGYDVVAEPDGVRAPDRPDRQSATVDELLTGRENLRLIGGLYGLDRRLVKRSTEELLERFSLAEAGDKAGQGLLRRHAPPARPRRQPDRHAPGALPRRADHRARPAQPGRPVGGDARPRRATARRCCSPRSTSTRPTSSPTASSSSTTGGSSPRARRCELKDQSGGPPASSSR